MKLFGHGPACPWTTDTHAPAEKTSRALGKFHCLKCLMQDLSYPELSASFTNLLEEVGSLHM